VNNRALYLTRSSINWRQHVEKEAPDRHRNGNISICSLTNSTPVYSSVGISFCTGTQDVQSLTQQLSCTPRNMGSRSNTKHLILSLDVSPSTLGGLNDQPISAAESTHWTLTAATHESRFHLPFRASTHDPYDLDSYPFAESTVFPRQFGTSPATDEGPGTPESANPTSHPVLVLKFQQRKSRRTKRNLNRANAKGRTANANKMKVNDVVEDTGHRFDHTTPSQPPMSPQVVGGIPHLHQSKSTTDLPNERGGGKWKSVKPLPPLPSAQFQSRFVEIFSSPTELHEDEYAKNPYGQGGTGMVRQSNDGHSSSPSRIQLSHCPRRRKSSRPMTGPRSPKFGWKPLRRSPAIASWDYLEFSPPLLSAHKSPVQPAQPTSRTQSVDSKVRGRDPPFPTPTDAQIALRTRRSRHGMLFPTGSDPRKTYSYMYVARMGHKF